MTEKPNPAPPGAPTASPQQAAAELGVPLNQHMQPNLKDHVPSRFVQLEEAQARGWSMYWDGAACRFGHQAAHYVSNTRRCSDCVRMKAGLEPVYPKSRAQQFYPPERIAKKDPVTGIVSAAPVAAASTSPPAPREPSKREQDFLSALAMVGDFDMAAQSVGMTRGQIEARASVDPTFKAALEDLCTRHSIPWTRAVDPTAFVWSPEIERKLVRRYVDLGLIDAARNELGVPASDYQQHLHDSPAFAQLIESARPRARVTLRERAESAADRGNDRLLKLLMDEATEDDQFMVLAVNGQRVPRPVDPDKAFAELKAILDQVRKELDQQEALGAPKRTNKSDLVGEPPEAVDDIDTNSEDAT